MKWDGLFLQFYCFLFNPWLIYYSHIYSLRHVSDWATFTVCYFKRRKAASSESSHAAVTRLQTTNRPNLLESRHALRTEVTLTHGHPFLPPSNNNVNEWLWTGLCGASSGRTLRLSSKRRQEELSTNCLAGKKKHEERKESTFWAKSV